MAPGMAYDDSGSLASYFGVTFIALLLFPSTYLFLKPPKDDGLKPLCDCSQCRANATRLRALKKGSPTRRLVYKILPLLAAWLLFGYLSYGIWNAPRIAGQTVYNPFEILGLGSSSTEKQIKKHYKKLSLQFHPDKIKLAENQTQEDADAKFVELTKAYKSLTDETVRENLAKYGNPDGPQQREDKIAIPQWVVEGKNNIWVLGAYGLVLGGGIPWVVGRWWFSQRRQTRDGILNATAEVFFHQLRDDTDYVSLIALLASALEFQAILSGKREVSKKERKERQGKVEELEKQLESRKEELGIEEGIRMHKDSRVVPTTAVARRARALIWSHLLRVDLEDVEMKSELLAVIRILPPLLNSLLNIALSHNWLATSELCIHLQPSLVQALPISVSPLAQFPDMSPEKCIENEMVKGVQGKRWLEKWVKLPVAEGEDEARHVALHWPRLEIVDAKFRVEGERVVTPGAIVQLAYRCRYIYPTTVVAKPKLAIANGDLPVDDAIKEENGDGLAVNGDIKDAEVEDEKPALVVDEKPSIDAEEEPSVDVKEEEPMLAVQKKDQDVKEKVGAAVKDGKPVPEIVNGYAHAPRWPQLRKPHYYVLLGDSKLDKVIVQPTRITDIPFPTSDGQPSEPKEFVLQFQAPPQANLYSFVAHFDSDTFLGADVSLPIMLKVEDAPEDESDEDGDISDPEEDSLAGQMAMMRGGKVKASGVHDEDESSEGEYESSSDEEGPKGGRKRALNEDSETDSD
ncbi:translocation protein SEC63, partial [Tremellales sp. Uapishka_1]